MSEIKGSEMSRNESGETIKNRNKFSHENSRSIPIDPARSIQMFTEKTGSGINHSEIMALQSSIGNQALLQMLNDKRAKASQQINSSQKREQPFGTLFDDVTIHQGPESGSIGAQAYTKGEPVQLKGKQAQDLDLSGSQMPIQMNGEEENQRSAIEQLEEKANKIKGLLEDGNDLVYQASTMAKETKGTNAEGNYHLEDANQTSIVTTVANGLPAALNSIVGAKETLDQIFDLIRTYKETGISQETAESIGTLFEKVGGEMASVGNTINAIATYIDSSSGLVTFMNSQFLPGVQIATGAMDIISGGYTIWKSHKKKQRIEALKKGADKQQNAALEDLSEKQTDNQIDASLKILKGTAAVAAGILLIASAASGVGAAVAAGLTIGAAFFALAKWAISWYRKKKAGQKEARRMITESTLELAPDSQNQEFNRRKFVEQKRNEAGVKYAKAVRDQVIAEVTKESGKSLANEIKNELVGVAESTTWEQMGKEEKVTAAAEYSTVMTVTSEEATAAMDIKSKNTAEQILIYLENGQNQEVADISDFNPRKKNEYAKNWMIKEFKKDKSITKKERNEVLNMFKGEEWEGLNRNDRIETIKSVINK